MPLLRFFSAIFLAVTLFALTSADFLPPAEDRYARVTGTSSILPGGRVIQPFGIQIQTGPGALALAFSPKGVVAVADVGAERFGITFINRLKDSWQLRNLWARTPFSKAPEVAEPDWKGVAGGIAFDGEKALWISEGDSGRLRLVDIGSGNHIRIVDLNQGPWHNSFTAALAFDSARRTIFVLDQANYRLGVVDAKKGQVLGSVSLEHMPVALALSPDGESVYVAVLGDPDVAFVDVRDAAKPVVTAWARTGASPAGILAANNRIFVSNADDDSVSVVDAATHLETARAPLRIPGLEGLRGIVPSGMAFDPLSGWLLVAESGINALGVIDTHTNELIAHIPSGWFPSAVAISGDRVYVANTLGRGTGPNLRRPLLDLGEPDFLHHGTVSSFIMPAKSELPKLTGLVYAAGGLVPRPQDLPPIPAAVKHLVLVVKESRSLDEVLGDIAQPGMRVAALPQLARFGMYGIADGNRIRFSVHDAAITPNQHAIARRWAFSDNFYADGDSDVEGQRWLAGVYPVPFTQAGELAARGGQRRSMVDPASPGRLFFAPGDATIYPEERPAAGTIWDHLQRHGVTFRSFSQSDPAVSDMRRADEFIAEMTGHYGDGKEPPPAFIYILLPNDRTGPERPADGFPYRASYVEDNDLALGRILEYLSGTPWWRETAVFVTEASASGGLDHVDSHRTILLAAGPWVRRNYIVHTNAGYPALLKTIFQALHVPPLNLMDATAASLAGVFTSEPDFSAYHPEIPDRRIFDASQ